MLSAFSRKIALILGLTLPVAAQQIAPRQIQPGQNTQSLQTIGGVTQWANQTGAFIPTFSIVSNGAQCTPGIDDSAAIATTISQALTFSEIGLFNTGPIGPIVTGCENGKLSYISNTVRMPVNLIYQGLQFGFNTALGAKGGVVIYGANAGTASGRWIDSMVAGCGVQCTGTAVTVLHAVGFDFQHVYITQQGGKGLNVVNSERITGDGSTNVSVNAQNITIFSSSNEIRFSGKVIDSGYVNVPGSGAIGCAYNPNAVSCQIPTSGTIYPVNDIAAVIVDGATTVNFDGPGSIKGSSGTPQFWVKSGKANCESCYTEQSIGSPGEIIGGPNVWTPTTASMTTSTLNVAVSGTSGTVDYGATAIDTRTDMATNLLQHYWIDSCSDAVSVGFLGSFVIYPPDYINGSTASSSLGSGIQKGQFEVMGGSAYCNVASPSLQLTSRGSAGGCSNPTGSAGACTQHAAIAWPGGAMTAEFVGTTPSVLSMPDSHLDAYDGVNAPLVLAPDNTTALTATELEVGNIPDPYLVQTGCSTTESLLILSNNEMFTDPTAAFTANPGIGAITAHTCAQIDLSQLNGTSVPTVSNDTQNTVYIDSGYGFGPSAVSVVQYPNGQSASLILKDSNGQRTISTNQGIQSQYIAPVDPATGISHPGITAAPDFNIFTRVNPPAQSALTVGSSGSIPNMNLSIFERYIVVTPYPPNGFGANYPNNNYPNTIISNGGTGWTATPSPLIAVGDSAGTHHLAVTTVATSGTQATICTGSALSGVSIGVGSFVTPYGFTATDVDRGLGGNTFTVASTSGGGTCAVIPYVSSVQAATSDTSATLGKSDCPNFFALGHVSGGAITGVSSNSGGSQGACTIAPNVAGVPLVFQQPVGTTTGSGAVGTLTTQGSYGAANAPIITPVTNGSNTTSVSVASPPADPSGQATYYQVAAGPQGFEVPQTAVVIGTPTVVTTASVTPTGPFAPKNIAYNAYPSTDFRFSPGDLSIFSGNVVNGGFNTVPIFEANSTGAFVNGVQLTGGGVTGGGTPGLLTAFNGANSVGNALASPSQFNLFVCQLSGGTASQIGGCQLMPSMYIVDLSPSTCNGGLYTTQFDCAVYAAHAYEATFQNAATVVLGTNANGYHQNVPVGGDGVGTITRTSGGTFTLGTGTSVCTVGTTNGSGTGLIATLALTSGGAPNGFTVTYPGYGYAMTSPITSISSFTCTNGWVFSAGPMVVTSTESQGELSSARTSFIGGGALNTLLKYTGPITTLYQLNYGCSPTGGRLGAVLISGMSLYSGYLSATSSSYAAGGLLLQASKHFLLTDVISQTGSGSFWIKMGSTTSGGCQNDTGVVSKVYIDGNSNFTTNATGTITLTAGVPSFTLATGGTYNHDQTYFYLIGYGANGQPCTTQPAWPVTVTSSAVPFPAIPVTLTASGSKWTVDSTVVAQINAVLQTSGTYAGCAQDAGGLGPYLFMPDMPHGLQVGFMAQSTTDTVFIEVGSQAGYESCLFNGNGGNSWFGEHAVIGLVGMTTTGGSAHYGADGDTNIFLYNIAGNKVTISGPRFFNTAPLEYGGETMFYIKAGTQTGFIDGQSTSGTAPPDYHQIVMGGSGIVTLANAQAIFPPKFYIGPSEDETGNLVKYDPSINALQPMYNSGIGQLASGNYAGTCTMAAATTCTVNISATYSASPVCVAVANGTNATEYAACKWNPIGPGGTVTITANASNSLTWGVILVGNPD